MVGGLGGSWFEDPRTDKVLSRINIWSDHLVRQLQCEYDDGTKTAEHGSTKYGTSDTFSLSPGTTYSTLAV